MSVEALTFGPFRLNTENGTLWRNGELAPSLLRPDKPSIVMLPFKNMRDDPDQEYFADGMVEDIIVGLSRIKWLFVIARNSSFSYKGKTIDVREIGRELGVRYVLEGAYAGRAPAFASPCN